jgi:hypothetical protein
MQVTHVTRRGLQHARKKGPLMLRVPSEQRFYKDDWKRLKMFAQHCYPNAQQVALMLSRLVTR